MDVARLRGWMQDILAGKFLTEQQQSAEEAAECGAARRDEAGALLQGWVRARTAEGELTRRYLGGCEVVGSWVTLDTEAGTIVTTAGGGAGAWLLYRGGKGALYTPLPATQQLSLAVFTGEAVSWLYPDLRTALRGHFVAGTMLAAAEARVTRVSWPRAGPPELELQETAAGQGTVYRFDPSTARHLSASPRLRDPYERQLLGVAASSVAGAGAGVFASTDLSNNTIVGYFNGVHLLREEVLYTATVISTHIYTCNYAAGAGGRGQQVPVPGGGRCARRDAGYPGLGPRLGRLQRL